MGQVKDYAKSIYGTEPQTMNEVGNAVIKVLNAYESMRYFGSGMVQRLEQAKCLGLAWHVTHSDSLTYTHCSPDGCNRMQFNDRNPDRPKYSGWHGRVWVRYESDNDGYNAFRSTLTHPGSGGGGLYGGPWDDVAGTHFNRHGRGKDANIYPAPKLCSWDYTIFDLDWPEVIETIEHERLSCLRKFEGLPIPKLVHDFLWEDPETKAADEAFLADCSQVTHQKEVLSLLR